MLYIEMTPDEARVAREALIRHADPRFNPSVSAHDRSTAINLEDYIGNEADR